MFAVGASYFKKHVLQNRLHFPNLVLFFLTEKLKNKNPHNKNLRGLRLRNKFDQSALSITQEKIGFSKYHSLLISQGYP